MAERSAPRPELYGWIGYVLTFRDLAAALMTGAKTTREAGEDPATGDVVRAGWDPESGAVVPSPTPDPVQPDPRPMTASEIYRTWFGLDRLTPNPAGELLRRYRVLADDPLPSDADLRERAELRAELAKLGIAEPDVRQAGS